MISQASFLELGLRVSCVRGCSDSLRDELKQFTRPYVLVIHQPSGRGFYLDRQYRHIVDVKNCQEPKNPTEVTRHHLCASTNLPAWAVQIENGLDHIDHYSNFDSFWLY